MHFKKYVACAVFIATFACMSFSSAKADEININTLTCASFNGMDKEVKTHMIFWFHGHIIALIEEEVFDDKKITKFAASFVDYCRKNNKALVSDGIIEALKASQ